MLLCVADVFRPPYSLLYVRFVPTNCTSQWIKRETSSSGNFLLILSRFFFLSLLVVPAYQLVALAVQWGENTLAVYDKPG